MNLDTLKAALSDRYTIERELGQGGMATVYLAEDLKHRRKVAIKVLKPELAAVLGAERFVQEITTTAALQHPHILPLFDSGKVVSQWSMADGDDPSTNDHRPSTLLYYVMPYIEGETLRDKLNRETQLGVDEAVRITREVADALDYAHRHGVVHRDIKPENILLHDGRPMVADFGIALAVSAAAGGRMTETGLSLGTPHYMSPEQATADKEITGRSDIYSMASVLYEMLTGNPPHTGSSAQQIIMKIVAEEAQPVTRYRKSVPANVAAALAKGLEKLPADRFSTAKAFAEALADPNFSIARPGVGAAAPSAQAWVRDWRSIVAVAAVALLAVLAIRQRGRPAPFAVPGLVTPLTWEQGLEITPALSPDGKQVAYASGNGTASRIYIRSTTDGRPVPLTTDSTAVETEPEWSHDGTRVLYIKDGEVFSAPAGGGPSRQEVPSRGTPVLSVAWSPDNAEIAYVVGDTILVHGSDGTSRVLATADQPTFCTWGVRDLIACAAGNPLYLLPGIGFGNIAPSWIVIVRVSDGATTIATDRSANNQSPQWSADGHHLLFASNRLGVPDIYSARVNDDGTLDGEPQRLTVGLNVSTFSMSADDAKLAYAIMTSSANVWTQSWNGRSAEPGVRPVQVTFGQQTIEQFSFSRDGQWLYYDSDLAGNSDLYRMSMATGIPERLTTDQTPEFAPEPSPDGREVAFHSFRGTSRDIYVLPLDGGALEQVTDTPDQEGLPTWSPDGSALAYFVLTGPPALHLATRNADGSWTVQPALTEGYWPAWSPDGRWLTFSSRLLGGDLRVISRDGGPSRALYDISRPDAPPAEVSRWSADGKTIYFKSHSASGAGSIWSVPATGGIPERLVELGDSHAGSDRYGFRITNGQLYHTLIDRQSNIWLMELNH